MNRKIIFFLVFFILFFLGIKNIPITAEEAKSKKILPSIINLITTNNKQLGWGGITIGMKAKDVEHLINKKINIKYPVENDGYGPSSTFKYKDRELHVDFSGTNTESVVEGIFISFLNISYSWTKDEIVAALKKQIPNIIYEPSRHWPNLNEKENETPLYLVSRSSDLAILVKPKEGLYLASKKFMD